MLRRRRVVTLAVVIVAACGETRFGRVVTEVSISPKDPGLLIVRSCELVETGKGNLDQVALGECKRVGVRRSAIRPVPVVDAAVLAREDRVVTGFRERDGGAVVTTCRIGKQGAKWALLDCADTEISTAPLAPAGGPP
ncbi:MAG: hypothetical protein KF773_11215 [Deltaproteobacteria bacterium]|nr:hypothetical protein [Deltaproteobacteria bacterium]